MALALFKTPEITPPADIEAASLRSDRFRLEREVDWQRLERIVSLLEKNRPRRINDEDLLELPVLYRKAASSLAVARETSLDAATLAYLESLVRRAWFQVYGPRMGMLGWLRRFLGGSWSASVRDIWLDICIALAVMVAGTLVGWLLVARDSEWYYALVPGEMGGGRQPGADRAALMETLEPTQSAEGLTVFATYLFSNNTGVCIMAFALGFCFGIPTLLLLVHNMAVLGAMMWLFAGAGLEWEFAAWLSVHGTTELFAILLSGAAGLHVGRSMAFPGDASILAAASASGKRAAQVMAGCTIMLVIAGLLEGYARQLVPTATGRASIGAVMLAFWIAYFCLMPRPRDHAQDRGDSDEAQP
ncbi:stage II sporulation protein M [Alteraurantiacibacter aestuarii]|uniref:Stage II sporulation protein M n=1 Tax=Alteraurantiacibacter aestuarii TaxID=650004 RepID=A0A844ZMU5_9SPHN|nr:stage II sporulation protein M [Alteraurantiacibacter aestuarii]MXO89165.1 stage II sporulation protein M [Alteraurantiacibacter aestuarii]